MKDTFPKRKNFSSAHDLRVPSIVLLLLASAASAAKPSANTAKPWLDMNRGPCLTASIESPLPTRQMTPKGLMICVNPAKSAYVLFDEDLLRYSAAWVGGTIDFKGIVFDGQHRLWPSIVGESVFGSPMMPGWAKDGGFDDPREKFPSTDYQPQPDDWQRRAYGPLPHDWARFKGLYLHGQRVIIAYTVGDTAILDSPGWEESGSLGVFTRTINLAPSPKERVLMVMAHPTRSEGFVPLKGHAAAADSNGNAADAMVVFGAGVKAANEKAAAPTPVAPVAVALVGAPAGARWQLVDGTQLRLHVPASAAPIRLKILTAAVAPARRDAFDAAVQASPPAEDLSTFTHGGPARWPEKVESAGKVGSSDLAYTVDTITSPMLNPWKAPMRFGGFDFFKDGHRAAICTWDGDVFIVDGIDDSLKKLTWQRIATGMFQPLGVKIVPDAQGKEQIFVCCRDQITRLHDLNGDGEIDFYESFNNDNQVTEHFHEFAMGLQTDAEGNFYYAKSARHALEPVVPQHGTLIKVSKDGGKTEILCNGFRAANGFGLGPNGEMAATDQEGHWTPANRINFVQPGHFYGNLWSYQSTKRSASDGFDPPLCWMPPKLDRSPAEEVWVDNDKWGPLKGSMIHTSYGMGKLFIVPHEILDGVPQGGVVAFPGINFPTGVMRARFSAADGQLYACGLVGWSSNCAEPGGFYRVRYTGKNVYLPVAIQVKKEGVLLTFTSPLNKEFAEDADNYAVRQWQYRWTENYGSPQFSIQNPNKQAQDDVDISAATLSADGKSVLLKIAKLRPVMQMQIDVNIQAADGASIKLTIHNTINRVP